MQHGGPAVSPSRTCSRPGCTPNSRPMRFVDHAIRKTAATRSAGADARDDPVGLRWRRFRLCQRGLCLPDSMAAQIRSSRRSATTCSTQPRVSSPAWVAIARWWPSTAGRAQASRPSPTSSPGGSGQWGRKCCGRRPTPFTDLDPSGWARDRRRPRASTQHRTRSMSSSRSCSSRSRAAPERPTAAFDEPSDSSIDETTPVGRSAVLIFDGLFLQRPEPCGSGISWSSSKRTIGERPLGHLPAVGSTGGRIQPRGDHRRPARPSAAGRGTGPGGGSMPNPCGPRTTPRYWSTTTTLPRPA